MARCGSSNDAQGRRAAMGELALRRSGVDGEARRAASRRGQSRTGGRHGRHEATRSARAVVARVLALHDSCLREAVAVAQAAVATRAARRRDAQMLVAQSFQGGDGRYPIRLMLDLEAETDRAFADSLAEGEAKLAEAERAMEALQQAMAALRDAEDAAAARSSICASVRAPAEAGERSGGADSDGSAAAAPAAADCLHRTWGGRARSRRVCRPIHRTAVAACWAAVCLVQASSGQRVWQDGPGEFRVAPAAQVRPSRTVGARGRRGDASAPGPCGPRLFGQPPGRPPGG